MVSATSPDPAVTRFGTSAPIVGAAAASTVSVAVFDVAPACVTAIVEAPARSEPRASCAVSLPASATVVDSFVPLQVTTAPVAKFAPLTDSPIGPPPVIATRGEMAPTSGGPAGATVSGTMLEVAPPDVTLTAGLPA